MTTVENRKEGGDKHFQADGKGSRTAYKVLKESLAKRD